MSTARTKRIKKRQLGQFITPPLIAEDIVRDMNFTVDSRVLEPSIGDGSFVIPVIEKFMELYDGSVSSRLSQILSRNVYGVEIDKALYESCLLKIQKRWGELPVRHNFFLGDFFRQGFYSHAEKNLIQFSHIVGNPPFGGTIDPKLQDDLDRDFGFRNGEKIKKETYSFFIVKSLDHLQFGGELSFICSDTFLTINTMRGLRKFLMRNGCVEITDLPNFSKETSYPMVVLRFSKRGPSDELLINKQKIARSEIALTANFSWRINSESLKFFSGPRLGKFMVATSGMTVGRNEYFLRKITNGKISEPFQFTFYEDPITLDKEISRARLGKLSHRRIEIIQSLEKDGATRRNVRIENRKLPISIALPHPDYCLYNKASRGLVYSPPAYVIYWKDDGDAVMTFKKNGNWYLHGVGGQRYFKREGLTWQLISQSLRVRYLPQGYILDSGSPCAFLRDGVSPNEFYFIFGWTLTSTCNYLLKTFINHTKNIQSKDFERLPYPFWVTGDAKLLIINAVKNLINEAVSRNRAFERNCKEIKWLDEQFAYPGNVNERNAYHANEPSPSLF